MQTIILGLGKAFRKSLVVLSLILFLVSGLFVFTQPSYAATGVNNNKLTSEQKIDRGNKSNESAGIVEEDRQQAYEEAVKEGQGSQAFEKPSEADLENAADESSDSGLVEQAKGLFNKVTGQD